MHDIIPRKRFKMAKNDSKNEVHKDLDEVCLMLQDTTNKKAPKHVKMLFSHFDTETLEPAELMFVLIYILALESGFAAEEEYVRCQHELEELSPFTQFHARNITKIAGFKPTYAYSSDSFTVNLRSLLCLGSENFEQLDSILTVISLGDSMVVTISPKTNNSLPGFSICLPIEDYIKPQSRHPAIYRRFANLSDLTRVVRNEILVPRLNQLYVLLETNISPSLEGLPYNLYDEIFKFLSPSHLRNLAHVSKTLCNCTMDSKYLNASSTDLDYDDDYNHFMYEY